LTNEINSPILANKYVSNPEAIARVTLVRLLNFEWRESNGQFYLYMNIKEKVISSQTHTEEQIKEVLNSLIHQQVDVHVKSLFHVFVSARGTLRHHTIKGYYVKNLECSAVFDAEHVKQIVQPDDKTTYIIL